MTTPKKSTPKRKKKSKTLGQLLGFDSAQARRDYRRSIAILKRAGLISKKTDARKAKPTRHYKKKIKEYQSVIKGKAVSRKAPKSIRDKVKTSATFKVAGTRIIVPIQTGEKVYVSKKGIKKVLDVGGAKITTRPQLLAAKDIPSWIKRERERLYAEEKRLGAEQFYSFQIFGNNSYTAFPNADSLLFYMNKYLTKVDEVESSLLENIAVVRIEREQDFQKWIEDGRERKAAREVRQKERRRIYDRERSRRLRLKNRQ